MLKICQRPPSCSMGRYGYQKSSLEAIFVSLKSMIPDVQAREEVILTVNQII